MHSLRLCVLLGSALLTRAAPHQPRAADPTVTIASGVVVGTATRVSNQPSVTGLANAYLGVPFAKSPPLRFAPPEAPEPWTTPVIAQTEPPACLQQFDPGDEGTREQAYFNNPGHPPPRQSEDCLYLNVFTPQDANTTELKPVMLWIYGGDLMLGSADLASYNGSSLAVNHDVVVVAPNYRTNIFGFSNSPEVPHGQQNSGFLDIRFGLQWVQDNIEKFGGDPTKVTIFGESAGGFAIKQILAQPPTPLPFRAAIMESEALSNFGSGLVSWEQVTANFDCALAPSPLECMRNVEGTQIQSYITDNQVNFFPVTDKTNVNYDTLPMIESGEFADVPILMGTNKDEGTVFASIFGLGSDANAIRDAFQQFGALGSLLDGVIDELLDTYVGHGVTNTTGSLVSQLITDVFMLCPAQELSTAIVNAGRQSVWRYRYDAAFPNQAYFPNAGAYHTAEIPQVFGTYALEGATQTQVELSAFMQKVWTDFAKDPSAGAPWPKLGSNGGVELGVLGGVNDTTGEYTAPLIIADYPCVILDPVLVAADRAY